MKSHPDPDVFFAEHGIRETFDPASYDPRADQRMMRKAYRRETWGDAALTPLWRMPASDFAGKPVPPREWHVKDWIPARNVTLLSADGGIGKSLIALQLGVSTVAMVAWLGLPVTPGPVIYLSAEDEEDEVHRRLADICTGLGVGLEALNQFHLVPMAGSDATLFIPEGKGNSLAETLVFNQLRELVEDVKPRLLILDTLADVFGGDENVRAQVRQFVNELRGLAMEEDVAILILAHPSLSGMASGSGLSGNTAWNNSVRSRLYMTRPTSEDGAPSDPDLRMLTSKKANFGRIGAEIRMRWKDGMFHPEGETVTTGFAAATAEVRTDQAFLELLDAYAAEGRHVSATRSANFAPTLFARDHRANGIRRAGFEAAMNRLFAAQRIRVEEFGSPARRLKRIVRYDQENRQ